MLARFWELGRGRPVRGLATSLGLHAAFLVLLVIAGLPAERLTVRRGEPLFVELPGSLEPPPRGQPAARTTGTRRPRPAPAVPTRAPVTGPSAPAAAPSPARASEPHPHEVPPGERVAALPVPLPTPPQVAAKPPEVASPPARREPPPTPPPTDTESTAKSQVAAPPPGPGPEPSSPASATPPALAARGSPRELGLTPAPTASGRAEPPVGAREVPPSAGPGSEPAVTGPRVAALPPREEPPPVDIRSALGRGGGAGSPWGSGRGGIEGEPIPLDTPDGRYSDYLERLRRRIKAHWGFPCVRNDATRACEYKTTSLVVHFGILRDGRLQFVEVVEPSGYRIYDDYAVNAIKLAAPFPPVPAALMNAMKRGSTGVAILARFNYIVETSLTNLLR